MRSRCTSKCASNGFVSLYDQLCSTTFALKVARPCWALTREPLCTLNCEGLARICRLAVVHWLPSTCKFWAFSCAATAGFFMEPLTTALSVAEPETVGTRARGEPNEVASAAS